ncbi:hypothetical protein [Pseudomonas baltica]|nr:hypothetical protein [Pseudomonas baltica]
MQPTNQINEQHRSHVAGQLLGVVISILLMVGAASQVPDLIIWLIR